jgi:hypothetical protein
MRGANRELATLLFFGATIMSCGGGSSMTGGGGTSGAAGKGGPGMPGAGGMTMPGMPGAGGMTMPGAGGMTGSTGGTTAVGGSSGVFTCTAGVQQLVVTDCGYPYASSNPLTSIVFNESGVLRAIQPSGTWPNGVVSLFYNDEHALTLGVRSVVVQSASGATTTDYPVSALPASPGSVTNPTIGANALTGDQSGLDASLRPMWPSLFVTDITTNPSSKAGDWQQGGRPITPNAVFGTWKAAVRTVDNTTSPPTVTITPDADPAKNNWSLGTGANTPPTGLSNEGYGTEARWNVPLIPGHSYRLQAIVHDGDQNKAGGDSGEACVLFCAGGSCGSEGCGTTGTGGTCAADSEGCGTTGTGGSGGGQCPQGSAICGPGGIDPSLCPVNTLCADGCCLPYVGYLR